MKFSNKSNKYHWEFIRRNEDYVQDWKKYFEDHNFDKLKRLLLKWGIGSFPESNDFELRWEDVPRQIEDGWSDFTKENQRDIIPAMRAIFPEASKNFALTSLSHKILTGAKDERKLNVPWDEKKNIFLKMKRAKSKECLICGIQMARK